MKQTRAMTDSEYTVLAPELEDFVYFAERAQEAQERISRIIAAINPNIVAYDAKRCTVTIDVSDIDVD